MKIATNIKHLLPALFLVAGSLCTSCTDEMAGGGNNNFNGEGLNLTLSVEPLSEKVMTRANTSPRTDRSAIARLDVVLANGEDIIKVIPSEDLKTLQTGYAATETGLVGSIDNLANLNLHIGTTDLQGVTNVYIVANYIDETSGVLTPLPTDKKTVAELKALKQGYPQDAATQRYCTMFGELAVNGDAHESHAAQEITLTRTLSMITLVIDGSGLHKGIVITPVSAQLKNVPTSCTITGDNKPTTTGEVSPVGHLIQPKWGNVGNTETGSNLIEVNQIVPADAGDSHINHSLPLFMFENKQGTNDAITDQKNKVVVNENTTDNTKLLSTKSYIEVTAKYQYSKRFGGVQTNNGTAVNDMGGEIKYRFWLGENITNNFDVTRNTHYMLTLKLTNWGGLVEDGVINESTINYNPDEDVSWRIDTDLMDTGVADNLLEVPAGGSRVDITLVGDWEDNTLNQSDHISYAITGSANTVWVKEESGGWVSNPSTAKLQDHVIQKADGTYILKIYIKPLDHNMFEAIGNNTSNKDYGYEKNDYGNPLNTFNLWMEFGYMDHTFYLDYKGEKKKYTFTIRQWLPMPVMVDNEGNKLESTDPRDAELYFSRFDIYHGEPLPWCNPAFYDQNLNPVEQGGILITDPDQLGIIQYDYESGGTTGTYLDYNPTYGFHNLVAYFITNRSKNMSGINFYDGEPQSVMEYAIFESANAELPDNKKTMFHDTPDEVETMDHYGLATMEEWVKIEKYGIVDPRYPLNYGMKYWTSTIPREPVGYSYIYEIGSLGTEYEARQRSEKFPGRMVYHKNDKAQFGTP